MFSAICLCARRSQTDSGQGHSVTDMLVAHHNHVHVCLSSHHNVMVATFCVTEALTDDRLAWFGRGEDLK